MLFTIYWFASFVVLLMVLDGLSYFGVGWFVYSFFLICFLYFFFVYLVG